MRVLLVAGLLLAGHANVACSQGCHDVGCESGVTLQLVPKDGSFVPGTYILDVGTAHETAQVECQIAGGESGCKPLSAAVTIWVGMSTQGATITIDGRPEVVSLRLDRDGQLVFTEQVVPSYSTVQPNGPDCGPTCTVANETLEL